MSLKHWLATPEDRLRTDFVKRFAPRLWTVDFPRPMMASAVTGASGELRVDLSFLRRNDLAGLIWSSEDRWSHPLLAYGTDRDYRGCTLRFDWSSGPGVMPLDAVNGPTLTIEGRDADGESRVWYVRLWNYATGTPSRARITLDFDALDAGFVLPAEARRVHPAAIDRLSISLVPSGYDGTEAPLSAPVDSWVELSDLRCDGEGSVLTLGDAFVPEHNLRMASGYDDSYHQTPERLVEQWFALGYRDWVTHYVGMSHYPALAWNGVAGRYLPIASQPLCVPAERWHAALAKACTAQGFRLIVSLSYELLAAHAPDAWCQRDAGGACGLTGWDPPSALLSPCHAGAMAWLASAATRFMQLVALEMPDADFQVGEPWWWVGADGRPCFYDAATVAVWTAQTGGPPPVMTDVRGARSAAERAYLVWLGARLASSTLALAEAARGGAGGACIRHLLFYAPQVLSAATPDLRLANMPSGWASPAWDTLQLEDYDFVIGGDEAGMTAARTAVTQALGYDAGRQHYFAGFVLRPDDSAALWPRIAAAARASMTQSVAQTFVWAWPQIARDGFTVFDLGQEEAMDAFHDVMFPLELGFGASGGPEFSTQIALMASGFEQRNSGWSNARLRYDAGLGVRSERDLTRLMAFFRARRGPAHGFRFRDPLDHSSADEGGAPSPTDQLIGVGDGLRVRFALVKRYGDGDDAEVRRITRPEASSVAIAVAGQPVTRWVVEPGGWIRLETAPQAGAAVTAGYLFDVPVRFGEDRIDVSMNGWRAGELPSVPLIELREAVDE